MNKLLRELDLYDTLREQIQTDFLYSEPVPV